MASVVLVVVIRGKPQGRPCCNSAL